MSSEAQITIDEKLGNESFYQTCFKRIEIGNDVPKPVKIHDNVRLGYGVIVMKGVTNGENSVIGMNSVVTKDIPANSIAAGSSAKVVKTIENKENE